MKYINSIKCTRCDSNMNLMIRTQRDSYFKNIFLCTECIKKDIFTEKTTIHFKDNSSHTDVDISNILKSENIFNLENIRNYKNMETFLNSKKSLKYKIFNNIRFFNLYRNRDTTKIIGKFYLMQSQDKKDIVLRFNPDTTDLFNKNKEAINNIVNNTKIFNSVKSCLHKDISKYNHLKKEELLQFGINKNDCSLIIGVNYYLIDNNKLSKTNTMQIIKLIITALFND